MNLHEEAIDGIHALISSRGYYVCVYDEAPWCDEGDVTVADAEEAIAHLGEKVLAQIVRKHLMSMNRDELNNLMPDNASLEER